MKVKRQLTGGPCTGFDTASSIALLAASAIAKKGTDSKGIPPGDIVILPVGCPLSLSWRSDLTWKIRCYSRLG